MRTYLFLAVVSANVSVSIQVDSDNIVILETRKKVGEAFKCLAVGTYDVKRIRDGLIASTLKALLLMEVVVCGMALCHVVGRLMSCTHLHRIARPISSIRIMRRSRRWPSIVATWVCWYGWWPATLRQLDG